MYLYAAAAFVKGRSRAHDDGVLTMSSVVAECDIIMSPFDSLIRLSYLAGVRLKGSLHDTLS